MARHHELHPVGLHHEAVAPPRHACLPALEIGFEQTPIPPHDPVADAVLKKEESIARMSGS
jgi:hypothetical protein